MAPLNQFTKSMWIVASIAVIVAALYLAKGVLVPLTLAVLLSFLLSPICNWFERYRLGRIPAVLLTAFVGFASLGFLIWVATVQMTELAPKIPEYQANLQAKLHSANAYAIDALSKITKTGSDISENILQSKDARDPIGSDEFPYSVRVLSSPMSPLEIFGKVFGTVLGVLGSTGLVIVLVVFFLIRRDDLRDRFIRLIGNDQVTMTTQVLEDAGTRVSRYLSTLLILNVVFGTAVGIGLHLIGLPNAILWGILAAVLRFIPYLGPWIAAALPIGLSMAISTGWVAPLLTIGLFVVLEILSNNIIEPWFYGKRTGVSAVAVLVAAVFWTWLWGVAGLLLATPLTVCLLVIGKHVPQLSFLDILLGSEPVFEPKKRVYQRLLAGDQEEATEIFDEDLEDRPLVEVYDTLLVPVLAMAETDWHRGELHEDRHNFILQSLEEMIYEKGENLRKLPAKEDTEDDKSPRPCILCLPARNEADEIAGMMLTQLLATCNCLVRLVPFTTAASQRFDLFENRPDLVCISATPPTAVLHVRQLYKHVRGRFPEVPVIVGLWNSQSDLNKVKTRIGGGDSMYVVATLAEAQERIHLLIPSLASNTSDSYELSGQTI